MKESRYIFFNGHRKSKTGVTTSCFSQFYDCEFRVDGLRYCCAEQFMMAGKARTFHDAIREKKIMASRDPADIKKLGRKVTPFSAEMWETVAYNVVARGNFYKFTQNEDLKDFLLATGDKILVEASPIDKIWGIGLSAKSAGIEDERNWRGQNLLGRALMEVRTAIRQNVSEGEFLSSHPIMNRRIVEWMKDRRDESVVGRVNDPTRDPEVSTGTNVREVKSIAEKAQVRRLRRAKEEPDKAIEDDVQTSDERKLLAAFDKAYRGHVYRNLLRDVKYGGRYGFAKDCVEIGGIKVYEPVRGSLRGSETSERFSELYGREAYEAWKRREAEIDVLMASHCWSKNDIIKMREDNYRRMKAAAVKGPAAVAFGAKYQAVA